MALHVVTGASAGMGRACVDALAAAGHDVVAVARRADALAEVAAGSPRIHTIAADVGTSQGRLDVVNATTATAPEEGIRSVIHGAATAVELQPWLKIDAEELTAHFAVHVAAPVELTARLHAAVGVERCIIFDSYSASTPRVGWSAYSILKAAAQMAFRSAAAELSETAVARVYPGAVATPLLDRVLTADRAIEATTVYHELKQRGRVSSAEEIAIAIVDLIELDRGEFAAHETWHVGHPADAD